MKLEFRRFQEKDFQAYASWFVDPDLDRWLGPLDREWLGAVLSEKEGVTWAVFRGETLVAVAETVFDPVGGRAAITAFATKPGLRRQGIGGTVLEELLALHRREGVRKQVAFVHEDNGTARRCLERVGFVLSAAQPNEYGYLEFWYGRAKH